MPEYVEVKWVTEMKLKTSFSPERKAQVTGDLHHGSEPGPRFFFLVAVSTLIAGLGLVMNSTAVVIGAMLVAPLMTPILGLALALVNGEASLLGKALRAEVIGVVIAVVVSVLLGLLIPYFRPTGEMLARTEPNLFDLLVAVFAGMAGAYAMVDERVGPALPGVAISTAIVPPLANCGLCIALGAFDGAVGSFLLFFTNFLSILLVSALVFHLTGMSESFTGRGGMLIARRFGVAIAGFLVVAGFLGTELWRMMDRRALREEVSTALKAEMSDLRISNVQDLFIERRNGKVLVLAGIDAPQVIGPARVGSLQRAVRERTGKPVELFVRTALTHDVSAAGSTEIGSMEKLDGYFPKETPSPRTVVVQRAEQAIREYLEKKGGITLQEIDVFEDAGVFGILAEISGFRGLDPQEAGEVEDLIRASFPDRRIHLAFLQESAMLVDRMGAFRSDFTDFSARSPEQVAQVEQLIGLATAWNRANGFEVGLVSTALEDETHMMLIEVSGPRLFTDADLAALRAALGQTGLEVKLFVRSDLRALVGDDEFGSFRDLLSAFRVRNLSEAGQ